MSCKLKVHGLKEISRRLGEINVSRRRLLHCGKSRVGLDVGGCD